MILAIDPGIHTGWAVFHESILAGCGLGDPPDGRYQVVVIERPQIYTGHTSYADPNDIITLAIGVGRYVERFRKNPTRLVLPAAWKGQTPKPIHNGRVLNALSSGELLTYQLNTKGVALSLKNNVIDAIGLGAWIIKNPTAGKSVCQ